MRLPSQAKVRFAALAAHHELSESALLARLVAEVLRDREAPRESSNLHEASRGDAIEAGADTSNEGISDVGSSERLTIRLRRGDRAHAARRARSRGMKTASYLAMLIHNHVRHAAVLPPAELDLIKASVAQLAALGRQLRMLGMASAARSSNCVDSSAVKSLLPESPTPTWSAPELFDVIARARQEVEAVRQSTAALVRSNLLSWESGMGAGP